jgi:branched-chain amino acid aminotransferase
MYYDDNTMVFLDGAWLKARDAQTNLYVQGLHYGNSVFEGIRAYRTIAGDTQIFKAEEHYDRLHYSARRMGIPLPYSVEELTAISYALLTKNGLSDAYLRPLVYSGPNMSLTTPAESHVFLSAWQWGKLLGDQLVRLMTSSFQRPNPKSCFVDAKVSGHYVNSILAASEAQAKGFDEALLLDANGHVAEAPGANFFFEKKGVLYTPPRGNILPGITRGTILHLCRKVGIRVEERAFTTEEVKQADGAFLVGTAAEVTGVESLDGRPFRQAWRNTFGAALQQMYRSLVMRELPHEVYL